MRQRTRVRKGEEQTEQTNRLTGIVVNEVSIVDRAANQRKFLVVKEAPLGVAPPGVSAPPAVAAPAPAWTIAPDLKAQLISVLKAASEKIAALSKRLSTATEAPGATAPAELSTLLEEIASLFPDGDADDAQSAQTQKAGRKMSSARLQRLNTIRSALDELIAEVDDAKAEDAKADETTDGEGSVEKKTTQKGEEPPAPAEPVALAEIKDALAELGSTLGKMMLVFEGQNTRIDALAKNHGESRQVDLEKAQRRPLAEEPVVWSLDMNKPIVRDAAPQRRF